MWVTVSGIWSPPNWQKGISWSRSKKSYLVMNDSPSLLTKLLSVYCYKFLHPHSFLMLHGVRGKGHRQKDQWIWNLPHSATTCVILGKPFAHPIKVAISSSLQWNGSFRIPWVCVTYTSPGIFEDKCPSLISKWLEKMLLVIHLSVNWENIERQKGMNFVVIVIIFWSY